MTTVLQIFEKRALSPPQTQSSCRLLGWDESISVDPGYLLASIDAACCVCVPLFLWQHCVKEIR